MPAAKPSDMTVHLLWLNAGLSCDGDSVSLTAATLPSVEDIVMGAIPAAGCLIVRRDTIDRLQALRGRHAVVTWDEAIDLLLQESAAEEPA